MLNDFIRAQELQYVLGLVLSLVCGLLIGIERELKSKPAGISTQTLVIAGAMTFAFLSGVIGGGDPNRIAAQIVSGIGFLGAGIIIRSEKKDTVTNVTTAASIWYSAAIGMALGFKLYFIALAAAIFAVSISRIPHVKQYVDD